MNQKIFWVQIQFLVLECLVFLTKFDLVHEQQHQRFVDRCLGYRHRFGCRYQKRLNSTFWDF